MKPGFYIIVANHYFNRVYTLVKASDTAWQFLNSPKATGVVHWVADKESLYGLDATAKSWPFVTNQPLEEWIPDMECIPYTINPKDNPEYYI